METTMSPIGEQLSSFRFPGRLVTVVMIAAVIGAVAVTTRPRTSEAQLAEGRAPLVVGDEPLVPLGEVWTGTHRVQVLAGKDAPILFAVYDSTDRPLGLYQELREVTRRFPSVQAAFDRGEFAHLALIAGDSRRAK